MNKLILESQIANEILLEKIDEQLLEEFEMLEEKTRLKDHIRHLIKKGKYFVSKKYRNKVKDFAKLKSNRSSQKIVNKRREDLMDRLAASLQNLSQESGNKIKSFTVYNADGTVKKHHQFDYEKK